MRSSNTTATASGVDRARLAAEQAVASPLLDGIDLSGARGVLVNVTASRSLKGKEIKEVMATVRAFAAPDASIAQGIAYDETMGDDVKITVIATGFREAQPHRRERMLGGAPVPEPDTDGRPPVRPPGPVERSLEEEHFEPPPVALPPHRRGRWPSTPSASRCGRGRSRPTVLADL